MQSRIKVLMAKTTKALTIRSDPPHISTSCARTGAEHQKKSHNLYIITLWLFFWCARHPSHMP